MKTWGNHHNIVKPENLKEIIVEAKLEKNRRDSLNSEKSSSNESELRRTSIESDFDTLFSTAATPKNKSSKTKVFLNFETYQPTRTVEHCYDDDGFDKTRLLEEEDLEYYREIYSVEHKSKMRSEKQTATHKTGQFKINCKLAKYQNKEFFAEPGMANDNNREKSKAIHDWLGKQ